MKTEFAILVDKAKSKIFVKICILVIEWIKNENEKFYYFEKIATSKFSNFF
jgi:hypothetical protein